MRTADPLASPKGRRVQGGVEVIAEHLGVWLDHAGDAIVFAPNYKPPHSLRDWLPNGIIPVYEKTVVVVGVSGDQRGFPGAGSIGY